MRVHRRDHSRGKTRSEEKGKGRLRNEFMAMPINNYDLVLYIDFKQQV